MSRTRIDIEEIERLQARRREINALELEEIDFYKDGVLVEAVPGAIAEWRFTGLGNVCYVEHEGWKGWETK